MTERPHGYARYQCDGCRCYECGFAYSVYRENRTKAITAGTWQPWVDAEPVRVHVEFLQTCLMGLRSIAAAANVDRQRLVAIVNGRPGRGTGPQAKVRPALAAAVLAVEPTLDNLGPNTVIGATGTTRRLRALVAGGWPHQHLAEELGWTPGNFSSLIAATSVTVRTARLVVATYDRLWNVDPATHGATARFIAEAKARAIEARWAPVGAWDDDTIDDPAAFPDWTGHCGTPRGDSAHRANDAPVCQPCLDARAAYRHELRQRRALPATA